MLLGTGCCCNRGDVLFWYINSARFTGPLTGMEDIYRAMGLNVQQVTIFQPTFDISSFKLIVWPIGFVDPVWWPQIVAGTWNGRLMITTENFTSFSDSATYLDGKSGITGIGVGTDAIDDGITRDAPVTADPLVAGQGTLRYTFTNTVSGGTTLSTTVIEGKPWISRNKVGSTDFVMSGDVNVILDHVVHNTPFIQNLWNVAV